ncbi:MAG: nicotinate (nicotinamide) nucleotide adenylyltransferase, partial [Thermoguttaceae bacterium]
MRLGVFGGTFDPVHYGHLLLAECCREQAGLDAVWFLPAAVPPHKQDQKLSTAEHRIAMLKLAIAGNERFSLCTYETDRGGINFTVDTLRHILAEEAGRDLFLLIGQDMLEDLPNWRDPETVCELALPLVVHRSGKGALDLGCLSEIVAPGRFEEIRRHQVEMPEIGLSASAIRSSDSRAAWRSASAAS